MRTYALHAGELASRAAADALAQANVAPSRITHLITVSCTGFQAPGVDWELIRQLGLPASTARTQIGFMGCHGLLNGFRVARAFAGSCSDACVLLAAVELCSLHQQYGWQPERVVANALFADGAGAIVGKTASIPERASSRWRVVANGAIGLPDSKDAMSWRIGNHGFEMGLSPCVPGIIRESVRPWLTEWLSQHQLSVDEVPSWAIHPGGPRILAACGDALGLASRQLQPSRDILARYGNMSSPTVLFILNQLIQSEAERPCVALAFGPGLAIEGMLVD